MRAQILRGVQLLWQHTEVRHFEGATRAPRAAQERKLLEILSANRDTVYGREHGFGRIQDVAAFQSQVPINAYEDLEPYVQRAMRGERRVLTREEPLMFAVTSGTTGKSKFIPVTPGYLAEYNHAVHIHTWRLLTDYPDLGQGTFLVPSSSDVEGHTEGGKPYGAISGFLTRHQPRIVRKYFALPYEVAMVKNVDAKYYLTLLLALQQDIRVVISVNPSSLVLLADKLQAHAQRLIADIGTGRISPEVELPAAAATMIRTRLRPDPPRARELEALLQRHGALYPKHAWPNLRVISCWKGGTMPLYLRRLKRIWGEMPVRDLGYMASEGRGSIPLVDAGAAGVLALTTHFFEFVPVDEIDAERPTCLTVDELESNHEYYVLFTTSSGLYRYHINDIVRVVDYYRDAPVIQFVRKGQGISSVTGEKLTESQVTASLLDVVAARGVDLKHFTLAPRWASTPYYELMVELESPMSVTDKRDFLKAVDQALSDANVEYLAKRESERLGAPVLHVVAPGTFDRFRQERVSQGAPEAQVKIPHLSPKMEFGKQFEVVEEVRLDAAPVGGGRAGS
jgi:GH3 auxin-responsive promoter